MGPDGTLMSYDQLRESISNQQSNSENGMSGSVVKICSGMGAQKDEC